MQTWLTSNNDIDFAKIFQPFAKDNLVSCRSFYEVLLATGYEFCSDSLSRSTDLMCLIRAISCTQSQSLLSLPNGRHERYAKAFSRVQQGCINIVQFLSDIREQPFKWWQAKLQKFLKMIKNQEAGDVDERGQRTAFLSEVNKFAELFPAEGSEYERFCQDIVLNRLRVAAKALTPILESGKSHITKSSLRKYILSQQAKTKQAGPSLQLSRLDCHLLVKLLYAENKARLAREANPQTRKRMKETQDRIYVS